MKTLLLLSLSLTACSLSVPGTSDVAACTTDRMSLSPSTTVDYVELRVDTDNLGHQPIAFQGTPCWSYGGNSECLAALNQTRSSGFENAAAKGSYLVWTSGTSTGIVTNEDDLRAFLGDIDTPDEAMLLVTLTKEGPASVMDFDCASDVTQTDDGWDVVAWSVSAAKNQSSTPKYHVTHDGTVTHVGDVATPVSVPMF
jgi:hypothetical protein